MHTSILEPQYHHFLSHLLCLPAIEVQQTSRQLPSIFDAIDWNFFEHLVLPAKSEYYWTRSYDATDGILDHPILPMRFKVYRILNVAYNGFELVSTPDLPRAVYSISIHQQEDDVSPIYITFTVSRCPPFKFGVMYCRY